MYPGKSQFIYRSVLAAEIRAAHDPRQRSGSLHLPYLSGLVCAIVISERVYRSLCVCNVVYFLAWGIVFL
jgi:hypothetical protein